MKRDHKKISSTAFNHIIFRTFYGIPLADKFMRAAKRYSPPEHLFEPNVLKKTSPIFEGRYRGGEEALENFIRKNPNCTVLELAAGFSLHGTYLTEKYPKIKYIETDLPAIIKMKEEIVKKTGASRPNLFFKSANALDAASVGKAASLAGPGSNMAIYCEGLLSYFDDREKKKIAKIVKALLKKFGGVWITPDPALSVEARKLLLKSLPAYRQAVKSAEKTAKQKFDDHGFKSDKDTDKLFRACGFSIRKHPWPTKLNSLQTGGFKPKKNKELKNILKKFGKVWILSLHQN